MEFVHGHLDQVIAIRCDQVQDSSQPRAWIESVGLIDSAWSEGHRGVSTQGADGVRAMEMADRGLVVIKFESSYGVRLDDYHPWRNGDDILKPDLRFLELPTLRLSHASSAHFAFAELVFTCPIRQILTRRIVNTRSQAQRHIEELNSDSSSSNNMSASVGSIGSQPGNAPGRVNVAPTGGASGAAAATGTNVAPTAGAAAAPGANVAPANCSRWERHFSYLLHGAEIFKANTKPFGELYDLDPQQLGEFITTVEQRSTRASWTANFQVPTNGGTFDFFKNYGRVSLADCQAFARMYVGQQNRLAQNSFQIAECLVDSLTTEARQRVRANKERYTFHKRPDGLCFLKCVIMDGAIDTVYTTLNLKEQMQNLNTMMVRVVDNNVIKFNTEVTKNLKHARSVGTTRRDPSRQSNVPGLHQQTIRRVCGWRYQFHGGAVDGQGRQQIQTVGQRGGSLDASKRGTATNCGTYGGSSWNAGQSKTTLVATTHREGFKPGPTNKSGKGRQREYAAWKLQAPKESEPKVKQHSGRTYHWCPHHKLWTAHKPADCTRGGTAPTPDPPRTVRSLQATTVAALVAGMDDESWSE
eukprot:scaffold22623_cov213-Cylindrotheca_fusiformis.AAC.2